MVDILKMSIDLTGKRVLRLTLCIKPFEVMVTGEKKVEYRKPSPWIKSRLFSRTKTGIKFKTYDVVYFTNGYGKHRPYFIAEFSFFTNISHVSKKQEIYSNGLVVDIENGDFIIGIGQILEIGNYENRANTSV